MATVCRACGAALRPQHWGRTRGGPRCVRCRAREAEEWRWARAARRERRIATLARLGTVRRALAGAGLGACQGLLLGVLMLAAVAVGTDAGGGRDRSRWLLLGFGRLMAAAGVGAVIGAAALAAWWSNLDGVAIALAAWAAMVALGTALGTAAGLRGWWEWID